MNRLTPEREAEILERWEGFDYRLGVTADMSGNAIRDVDALLDELRTLRAELAEANARVAELEQAMCHNTGFALAGAALAKLAEANAHVTELVETGRRVLRCVDHACDCDVIVRNAIAKAAKETP